MNTRKFILFRKCVCGRGGGGYGVIFKEDRKIQKFLCFQPMLLSDFVTLGELKNISLKIL